MPNSTIEKEVCENCGAEARENTQFCYNCGTPLAGGEVVEESREAERDLHQGSESEKNGPVSVNGTAPDSEARAALEELSNKLNTEQPDDNEKLAQAAEQRRKARVVRRQPKQYTWEPADDMSALRLIIVSIVVAIAAGIAVLITIFWR